MKNKLYIMSGCPGSGKTTYAKKHFPSAKYISRDEIRFNKISEEEEYFSKEDEVFKEFVREINEGLRASLDVVADATHLNEKSRTKLLYNLSIDKRKTQIELICMQTPLKTCIERNENRKGTRSYVPKNILKRMYYSFKIPNSNEDILDVIHIIQPYEDKEE